MIGQAGRVSNKRFDKKFDSAASLKEAQSRLPLVRLMEQHGHHPKRGSFTCPFCSKKGKASVFKGKGGGDLFICHSPSCPSQSKERPLDEVGYLALVSGLSRTDAFVAFLKDAGVWEERAKFKSPDVAADRLALQLTQAKDAVIAEQDASAGLLQRRLKIGHAAALSLLERLERIHIVGPPGEGGARPVLVGADAISPDPATPDASQANGPAPEPPVDVSPPSDPADNPVPQGASDEHDVQAPPGTEAGSGEPTNAEGGAGSADLAPGNIVPLAQPDAAQTAGGGAVEGEEKKPAHKPLDVVRALYARLVFHDTDEERCWRKRGLESATCAALGFRSNTRSNKRLLEDLAQTFDEDLLLDSGLWKRSAKERGRPKPSGKFWGWSKSHKDSEDYELLETSILIPYLNHRGELIGLRPHKDMGQHGTTTGRPHLYVPRRMPQNAEEQVAREFFRTCVVTEGEFKAAALWQILGLGRKDGRKPLGVAALPGISFAKHYDVREELNEWLRMTRCERVVVVYDNEDKGTEFLADGREHPAFKKDWQKRHDAQKWARYLATDLSQRLHIKGHVGVIPDEHRDELGKADWDGVMAKVVNA